MATSVRPGPRPRPGSPPHGSPSPSWWQQHPMLCPMAIAFVPPKRGRWILIPRCSRLGSGGGGGRSCRGVAAEAIPGVAVFPVWLLVVASVAL